jgi:succinoglycan biosynthesis transport protein ExoP
MTPAPSYRSGRSGVAAKLKGLRRTSRPLTSETKKDFRDYLGMLLRRKRLAAGVLLAMIGLTVASIVRTRPVYQAKATFMMTDPDKNSTLDGRLMSLMGDSKQQVSNCIELLRCRSLAEIVAKRVGDSLKLSAGELQSMVTARPVRQTDIIEIVASGPSRATATTVANGYLDAYQQFDLDQSRAEVRATRQFIEGQLAVAGPRMDSFERSLEQYKTSHQLADLDAETKALVDHQAEVAAELQQVDVEIKAGEAQLAQVKSQIEQAGDGASDRLQGAGSPLVSSLQNSLNQLEVERANLVIGGFSQSSQRLRDLDRQIDSTRAQLKATLRTLMAQQQFADPVGQLSDRFEQALALSSGLTAARARREALTNVLSGYSASLVRLPETERVLVGLTRDAETGRRVHSLLSERYEEARIQEAGRVASVRPIDHARSAAQTQPNVGRSLALGLMLALGLAVGSVWLAERLDISIHGQRELERNGYAVIASVPQLVTGGPRRRRRNGDVTSHLITHTDVESSGAEAFRMLRTGLSFANVERKLHTIAVTSPGPSEGKSTVAVNLASVLAQAGARVLLVDADMRHPALHSVFKHTKRPGLSDLIVLRSDPATAIFPTKLDGLYCLPCGTVPPSPADLLTLGATRSLLERLEGEYGYVVIDTPPVLVAADTPIIGALADTTVMVVRAGKTTQDALEDARGALLSGGAHVSGLVVNDVKHTGRYGRYYYHYYKYHYRYAKHTPDPVEPAAVGQGSDA